MSKQEVKLSICLIVYNHEKYLVEAIESILMQNVNFKYEIIVGDDKSSDNSRKILSEYKEKFPDKINLLFQEENVGGTKNIYDLFMKSKGEYLTCLEGDDYWIDVNKLQKQVDFLDENVEYLGVSHIIEARDIQNNIISRHPTSSKIIGKDASIELFLNGVYFSAMTTVFRNIFKDNVNDYSIFYKAHKYIGDFTLCMILLDRGKIRILKDVMSVYRSRSTEGESNYNSLRDAFEQYDDHLKLMNAIDLYFNGKYSFTKEYDSRTMMLFLYSIKYNKIMKFYQTFIKIPGKIKFNFLIHLPKMITIIILQKCKLIK